MKEAREAAVWFLIGLGMVYLLASAVLEPIGDPRQHQSISTPPAYGAPNP